MSKVKSSLPVPISLISKKGYGVFLNSISKDELESLEKTLTVKPSVLTDYDFGADTSFPVYRLSDTRIYLPRYYGLKKYGHIENKIKDGVDANLKFKGQLKEHQTDFCGKILNELKNNHSCIACSSTGSGKCMGINTPIIMFDGSIKMVQDIHVGDLLIGDDSTSRKVLSLGRGRDTMYEIIPTKGESYVFNSEHILCLKCTNIGICEESNKFRVFYFNNKIIEIKSKLLNTKEEAIEYLNQFDDNSKICEISIKNYQKLSKTLKHVLKIYRVPINFPYREIPFDPYIIGFWIGDGRSAGTGITSQDSSVLQYLSYTLPKYGCYLQYTNIQYDYRINGYKADNNDFRNTNSFLNALKQLKLIDNKHIPDIYKINSREIRLQLLAGLIDSDGHLGKNGCYEFTQKNEIIMDEVIYLARSLGFAAYKSVKKTSWTYLGIKKHGTAFRTTISGGINEIPCKVPRKKAQLRQQIKDVLVTGFKIIEKGLDKYYGFELDGNGRYLLENFTVTHNTAIALWISSQLKKRTLIIVHKQFLLDQWVERIKQFLPESTIGIIKQNDFQIDKDIVIGMIQTIVKREYPEDAFKSFHLTIFDECLTYDQLVITDKGPVKIGILYNIWNNKTAHNNQLKQLPKVLSYNESSNTFEFKNITYAWEKSNEDILKISYGRGNIKCTKNHKILTPNGYLEAGKMKVGDLIKCNFCPGEQNPIARDLNNDQYQLLLGSFLGDGHIQHITACNRYRLKIIHCEKQKEYCEWKASMFNCKISKIEENGYSKGIAYNFSTKIFDLVNIIPKTKTTCPQWILDDLDYKGLAIWWMDDGCLSNYAASGTLSTCSFDEESHIRIITKLNSMGIESHYKKDGHGYFTVYFNRCGIYELMKKIRQYSHVNMRYKFYNEYLTKASLEYFEGTYETIYSNTSNINPVFIHEDSMLIVKDCTYHIKKCEKCENFTFHLKEKYFKCCVCKGSTEYYYKSLEPPPINSKIYEWNYDLPDTGTIKIKSIDYIKNPDTKNRVYDLEIEINHNFVLSTGQANVCGPIVHNCHHVGAQGFSQIFFKLGTKMTLGLSATPKRVDGLTKVIEWFLGSIIKNEILSEIEKPTIKFIEAEYSSTIVPKFNFKGNLNNANMVNQLVADDARNNQIIKEIILLNKEGRKILVLSGRRGHCEYLAKELIKYNITAGLYLGGMPSQELEKSNEKNVILGTYSMVSEAYDNSILDTLIMATGMGNVQQSIGRILRKKNKFNPLVIDFTDILYFGGQARRRKQFYKKSGYFILKNEIEENENEIEECLFEN